MDSPPSVSGTCCPRKSRHDGAWEEGDMLVNGGAIGRRPNREGPECPADNPQQRDRSAQCPPTVVAKVQVVSEAPLSDLSTAPTLSIQRSGMSMKSEMFETQLAPPLPLSAKCCARRSSLQQHLTVRGGPMLPRPTFVDLTDPRSPRSSSAATPVWPHHPCSPATRPGGPNGFGAGRPLCPASQRSRASQSNVVSECRPCAVIRFRYAGLLC